MMLAINDESPAPTTMAGSGEGQLDFVAGSYEFASISYTAAQVVGDRDDLITANGLEIPAFVNPGGSVQIVLSPFTAKLATCRWTMVLEVNLLSVTGGSRNYLFTQSNTPEDHWIEIVEWNQWFCDCGDVVVNPIAVDAVNSQTTGIHRIAATRINNKVSISVDGNDVITDTTALILPAGHTMTKFYFGGYSEQSWEGFYLRSCALYDPVDDSLLPGLSELTSA